MSMMGGVYTGHVMFADVPYGSYHTVRKFVDVNGDNRIDVKNSGMVFHFVELPKVSFKDIRHIRKADTWAAYFSGKFKKKEMEDMASVNPLLDDAIAFENEFFLDPDKRFAYIQREMALRDQESFYASARNQGLDEGRKEGILSVARKMLQKGDSVEHVAVVTDLSCDEVRNLL